MWPFAQRPKPGAKLSIINVHDYPRRDYRAYWEVFITPKAPHMWIVNLIDFDTGANVGQGHGGPCATEEDARRESQTWVLERIESHRRPQ